MKWLKGFFGDPGVTRHQRDILASIEQLGFNITNVVGDAGDAAPDSSYTVGFPGSVGQPDVIVFGQPLEVRVHMLVTLFERCRDGFVPADFEEVHGLLAGHHCILREVLPANLEFHWFNAAAWYQNHIGTPMQRAMQLVWPSATTGLFPWEDGCAETVRTMQPPLYEKVLPE